ncbi:hypothetical protein ACFL5P_03960 [candidate division KSB1 bacterium]
MPSYNKRQKYLFAINIISIVFFALFISCAEEKPLPFPTFAEELAEDDPPGYPINPTPANNALNTVRTVVLRWQVDNPDPDSLVYYIWFNTDSTRFYDIDIDPLVWDHPDTFFAMPNELLADTKYYWKIDVRDESFNWRYGDIWNFTTGSESNNIPDAEILSPGDNDQFLLNEEVVFRASASDIEDGILSGSSLVWTSNINGIIGNDTSFTTSSLSAGVHFITLRVTDSGGKSVSKNLQITVLDTQSANIPPSSVILFPGNGAQFGEDATITFRGRGLDVEDGILSGSSLEWSSSVAGVLGTDSVLAVTGLEKGQHTITFRATDSGSLFHESQVNIEITQVFNLQPIVDIIEPLNFKPYATDSVITFSVFVRCPTCQMILNNAVFRV